MTITTDDPDLDFMGKGATRRMTLITNILDLGFIYLQIAP
jgi:hypothetical protein